MKWQYINCQLYSKKLKKRRRGSVAVNSRMQDG